MLMGDDVTVPDCIHKAGQTGLAQVARMHHEKLQACSPDQRARIFKRHPVIAMIMKRPSAVTASGGPLKTNSTVWVHAPYSTARRASVDVDEEKAGRL
jgi:hypothetical protein